MNEGKIFAVPQPICGSVSANDRVAPTLCHDFAKYQGLNDQHIDGGGGLFVYATDGQSNDAFSTDVALNLNATNEPPYIAHALNAAQRRVTEDGTGRGTPLVAYPINTLASAGRPDPVNDARMTMGVGDDGDPAFTLQSAHSHAVATLSQVRRLTPRECERLQGFPDDYTDIPWRGKEHAPDGPRYKALGNSMAVPVMKWIGERIQLVENLIAEEKK